MRKKKPDDISQEDWDAVRAVIARGIAPRRSSEANAGAVQAALDRHGAKAPRDDDGERLASR
ncbi:MAG: hypothetical protein ACLPPF_14235 [Rhodomicrobium sp.]